MNNTIHFYWVDHNRKKSGCAKNYNLIVDYTKKTIKTFINPFYGYTGWDSIQCYKKSDIINHEKHLESVGFTRVDDF